MVSKIKSPLARCFLFASFARLLYAKTLKDYETRLEKNILFNIKEHEQLEIKWLITCAEEMTNIVSIRLLCPYLNYLPAFYRLDGRN